MGVEASLGGGGVGASSRGGDVSVCNGCCKRELGIESSLVRCIINLQV